MKNRRNIISAKHVNRKKSFCVLGCLRGLMLSGYLALLRSVGISSLR